jgi:hypothetical protein
MTKHEKTIQRLESFIEAYKMKGACYMFVVPRELDNDRGYHIHLYIDRDWIGKQEVRPHLVAKKLRDTLQKECKDYTGIDVYVTSSAKTCDKSDNLSESMPPHVKRRLDDGEVLDELNVVLEYDLDLSAFENASDCVEEVCDVLNERLLDYIWEQTGRKVSLAEKDELYWYLHKKFGGYINRKYRESRGLDESKKDYIVTESQLNLILESQKYRQLFEEVIQREIKHIQKECEDGMIDYPDYSDDEHCKQLKDIEKIEVTDADWVTITHSNKTIEQKYMHIKLMVYYSSIRRGDFDADDIAYELERKLRKSTGMPLIINYESTNTNTFFEW